VRVERIGDGPIISPDSEPSVGHNIQGPSVIRVPDWVPDPLGRFYIYFADHKGAHIRLAYADTIEGPWIVHAPGALQLAESHFATEEIDLDDESFARIEAAWTDELGNAAPADLRSDLVTPHIASPDVHVDEDRREIVMFFHGLVSLGRQCTRRAVSADGVHFVAAPPLLGPSYFRVFEYGSRHYALVMPGTVRRSADGVVDFSTGPTLFEPAMRHSAVRLVGDTLEVYWTRAGDCPERILRSTIDLRDEWMDWNDSEPVEILRPEREWEGAAEPLRPSLRGAVNELVNQLRDPCIFEDDGHTFLFYACGGEAGIAVAELIEQG
jgi:hypothetical protein